jgi:hypothetical protein
VGYDQRHLGPLCYAKKLMDAGEADFVSLLHVCGPDDDMLLKARSHLTLLSKLLDEQGVKNYCHLRSGNLAFAIIDFAEQMQCIEIVMPSPSTGVMRLFSHDLVAELRSRRNHIPVVTVDEFGMRTPG